MSKWVASASGFQRVPAMMNGQCCPPIANRCTDFSLSCLEHQTAGTEQSCVMKSHCPHSGLPPWMHAHSPRERSEAPSGARSHRASVTKPSQINVMSVLHVAAVCRWEPAWPCRHSPYVSITYRRLYGHFKAFARWMYAGGVVSRPTDRL